ncbi:MAG: MBL fold metallo-hydrolase [Lachnospiraceae bacterium]|nr:MBL fold metallo-hydrolase [Lachnospiraceae bacterium]
MKLCSIASGSSGNCIFAGTDKVRLLIDTGISGKRIEEGLNEIGYTTKEIDGILVTHEHSDHISGLGVVSRRYGIPIYTTRGTKEGILKTKSVGEIPEELFQEITPDQDFAIGDLMVSPVSISHDAMEPTAFILRKEKKSMAVMTDLGRYDHYLIQRLQGLDVLLLEANHDVHMLQVGTYPYYLKQRILGDKGHLSNELSGQFLSEILHDNFKMVILGHLSKENNYEKLAYETVRLEIDLSDSPYRAGDFPIQVARRDMVSDIIEF